MAIQKTFVRDRVTSDIKTIQQDKPILEAAKLMAKHKIGALIVVNDQGHAVGIFTERDLLTRVLVVEKDLKAPVADVMTRNLVCAQLHDEFDPIPALMISGKMRHIPVMDGEVPIGILSIRDALEYLIAEVAVLRSP